MTDSDNGDASWVKFSYYYSFFLLTKFIFRFYYQLNGSPNNNDTGQ